MKKFLLTTLTCIALSFGVNAQTIAEIVANSPDHNTLEAALNASELTDVLDGTDEYTLFAPTDEAFANLPDGLVESLLTDPSGVLTQILTYHVVPGVAPASSLSDGQMVTSVNGQDVTVTISNGMVMIDGATVTTADIQADNGIVHVINAVLIPANATSMYDVVANSPDHTTLETAIDLAGLDGTLSGPGTFTLFAPTDAAFALVDPDVLSALLADPQGLLTDVLLYHVVGSIALSSNLVNGPVPTLYGEDVNISINGSTVMVNDAMVSAADIVTVNGVVHVINAVLVPTTLSVDEIPSLKSLDVFPNPAVDQFSISMDLIQAENVSIDLTDITGKVIYTEDFGNLSSGQITKTVDVNNLESGIYMANIMIGTKSVTTKVYVSK